MGFFAESTGRRRVVVQEDFSLPVTCPGVGCGRVEGVVTDADSGAPIAGATVTIDGPFSGIPVELSAVTAADGSYTIDDVPNHEYGRVVASAPGFSSERASDVRVAGTATLGFGLTRNWAQLDGGAAISGQVGPGLPGESCGADLALDGDLATGWTTRRIDGQRPSLTIRLPQPVDIDRIAIGPAPCAHHGSAVEDFSVFTRRVGEPWVKALVNRERLPKGRLLVRFPLHRGRNDVSQVRLVLSGAAGRGPHVSLAEFRVRGLATT
jgi:extracellular elastinolytic metalloproteinase